MIKVFPVACLRDNYSYVVKCVSSGKGVIIDPVMPSKAFKVANDNNVDIKQCLVTHHHSDHHDIPALHRMGFGPKTLQIISGDKRISHSEITQDRNIWKVGEMSIQSIYTGGHTLTHFSYLITHNNEQHLFTGDFLFIGGCGKLFEGSPSLMWKSIEEIMKLPNNVKVWVGHEYTLNNYKWANALFPTDEGIIERKRFAETNACTIPSTLLIEKESNLFLRCNQDLILRKFGTEDPVYALEKLRENKDLF
eukprot:NODE_81_length_22758_cov_0.877797.p10 type:complete len:250 gc:universal NODE_81_length_22758_cov_0.877797:7703-8452(+)